MFGCKKIKDLDDRISELDSLIKQISIITNIYNKELNSILKKIKKLNLSNKDISKHIIKNSKHDNLIYEKLSHKKYPIKLYDLLEESVIHETINSIPIRQRGLSAPPILLSHIDDSDEITMI